jgi:D-glycero-D-manno-heptose 1,7-bisphosphate phosphatase
VARAVFLDRDGVLVVPEFRDGRSFAPTRLEDYVFYRDAASALWRLKVAGFLLVVVTNQPDVGKGVTDRKVIDDMHALLRESMPVDVIMSCFHTAAENCDCRKPKPGMLLEAALKFRIDLAESFMVGDRASDVEAGRVAGCRTVFIDLNYASEKKPATQDFTAGNLTEATDIILGAATKNREQSWNAFRA